MTLREFDVHEAIRAANPALPAHVLIPPGDDLGMIEFTGSRLLAGVDQVILGRHCRHDEAPEVVGRKAMLRALSDVAAMAATPVASLATAAVVRGTSTEWASALHKALGETGAAYGAPLIGGDIAVQSEAATGIVVTVTVLAMPALPEGRVIARHGAAAGDQLVVSGTLGGSLDADGGGRHLDFCPRLKEAVALAEVLGDGLTSMIDVSDGVASDARHLVEASTTGIRCIIDASRVPARSGMSWRQALGDGEDYELLFTVRSEPPQEVLGVPLSVIGQIVDATPDAPPVLALDNGMEIDLAGLGWEHR